MTKKSSRRVSPARPTSSTTMHAVWLACPRCRRRWLGGMIDPCAWWSGGVTPQKIATLWYCPQCDAPPPMRVIVGKA